MPFPPEAKPPSRHESSVPAVSIAGLSGSGKTTLVEKLVPALVALGLRVGTIKHQGTPDEPGKDTFRHAAAGACKVALLSSGMTAVFSRIEGEPDPIAVIREHFQDVDVVVVEGFKRGPFPKIEVARAQLRRGLMLDRSVGLIAVAADFDPGAGVPVFGLEDAPGIARFIKENVMTGKPKREWKVRLRIDDRKIPMNRFVQDAFKAVITGLVGSLKDVPADPSSIVLELDRAAGSDEDKTGDGD